MRLGYYTPSWPPGSPPNGISTYVASLAKQLEATGSQVSIFSSHCTTDVAASPLTGEVIDLNRYTSRRAYIAGKLINPIRPGYTMDFPVARPLKLALSEYCMHHGLDVFEMEESFGWARWLVKLDNVLKVVRLHGPHFLMVDARANKQPTAADRYRIRCEKKAMLSADLVTAPSRDVLESCRSYYGIPLDNALVIPNGISMSSSRWALDSCDRNMLLFVGRFDRVKGGDLVLKAFQQLFDSNPTLRLAFVGPDYGCDDGSGAVLDLRTFIGKHLATSAANNIDIMGYQTPSEIEALRRKARVTVVASRYEVFGYNALEAIAAACPLVCSRAGGLVDLFVEEQSALGFERESVEEMVSQVQRLLDDDALSQRLANQAYQDCMKYFAIERVAEKTLCAYHRSR